MFGIGMTEMIVILVIALVVLGPKKLPELARSLGKSLAELRRASTDLRREFSDLGEDARIEPPPRAQRETGRAAPGEAPAAPDEAPAPPAPEGRVGG